MSESGSLSEAAVEYRSPQGRWILLATVLGSALAAIDSTVVGIALPTIGREFDTGLADLQWVVTAYMMTLAGLLLVAGALGDRYGRRRVFVAGVVWFALASLLCAMAPSAFLLIVGRALQGVGAALLIPGSLAILQGSFTAQDRGKAIGAWSGLGGVATALGPFLGGWLVEAYSWRLIFLINLPLAAVVVLISLRHVPESRDRAAVGNVDVIGGVLITGGLIGLTYALIEGPVRGWDAPLVLLGVAAALLCLPGFFVWERRTPHPILPLGLLASAQFRAANAVTFIVYGALGAALFLLPIQLQQVSGYSVLASGIALLPLTAIMLAFSASSGALATRIGPRLQMAVGPVIVGAGLALMSRAGADAGYLVDVLPAVLVLGAGLATVVAPLTTTALEAAPREHAGVASAVNNDVSRAAGLIAVAVLPAAVGITGGAYLDPAVFDTGFRSAVWLCGGLCIVGGVLAAFTIRNPLRRPNRAATSHCALEGPPLHRCAD
ncbi:MFS transporter [Nocardiopsis ansamitocini]|uniref:MFS transporter n=1 Tax=Nocardiopsis ansamitocini TaxID=1670832 RepID=A0A9W6PA59_9ACTN|nr:MFS transporter [Nocardiopsis ansamitocini]GLU49813.1 MFS transporter [Nocardiopsis ansamitocini]